MLYAEILSEVSDSKNVFSLTYETAPLMIEGSVEEQNYWYVVLSIILSTAFYFAMEAAGRKQVSTISLKAGTKEVKIDIKDVIVKEIEQKRMHESTNN